MLACILHQMLVPSHKAQVLIHLKVMCKMKVAPACKYHGGPEHRDHHDCVTVCQQKD